MSPFEHGHVSVLDRGGESVLNKEKRGNYLGKTVQIESVSVIPVDGKESPADVCVIKLGGTVGIIKSIPIIEALRQLSFSVGQQNFYLIYVNLIQALGVVKAQKTKPTQHSVRELRALGLTPYLLACRSAQVLISSADFSASKSSILCRSAISSRI